MLGRLLRELLSKGDKNEPDRLPQDDAQYLAIESLYSQKRYDAAQDLLNDFLIEYPEHIKGLCLAGALSGRALQFEESAAWYHRALAISPLSAQAKSGLGLTLYESGQYEEAYQLLQQAIRIDPGNVDILTHMGVINITLGNFDAAGQRLLAALQIDPKFHPALLNMGILAKKTGNAVVALDYFRKAVEVNTEYGQGWTYFGLALRDMERIEEAIIPLGRAVELYPHRAKFRVNLAVALLDLGRYTEARQHLDAAIGYEPAHANAHATLALLHQRLENPTAAVASFRDALRIEPGNEQALGGLGELELWLGNFTNGWEHYEYRKFFLDTARRYFDYPQWHGESLKGKTILIYAEQGMGDMIMFASCLPDVITQARQVVIECYPRLESLFRRSFPGARIVAGNCMEETHWQANTQSVDYQCLIGDLPRYFRLNWSAFPSACKPYLLADKERAAYWGKHTGEIAGNKLRVGICWRGGLDRTNKRQRSTSLNDWRFVLKNTHVQCFALQYLPQEGEMESLQELRVPYWPEAIYDLDEMAALVSALDLVITVCSTVVHMTGALGKPVWVLAQKPASWRYLQEGDRLPWYPSARVIRQPVSGDWESVFNHVAEDLPAFKGNLNRVFSRIDQNATTLAK